MAKAASVNAVNLSKMGSTPAAGSAAPIVARAATVAAMRRPSWYQSTGPSAFATQRSRCVNSGPICGSCNLATADGETPEAMVARQLRTFSGAMLPFANAMRAVESAPAHASVSYSRRGSFCTAGTTGTRGWPPCTRMSLRRGEHRARP